MSVIGSLEDLSFPDLLQVIHVSRQSGTLILSGREGERRVRFRNGLVCGARLGEGGPELEEVLADRGMVDPVALQAARARRAETGEPLSTALVALRAISQETIERVVREELRSILRSLVLLQEGDFRFELDRESPSSSASSGIGLAEGLGPESILGGEKGARRGRGRNGPRAEPRAGRRTSGARRAFEPKGVERVLLVMDRAVLRTALCDGISKRGFRVDTCVTPSAGLDAAMSLARRGEPFCLICDLILPEATDGGWTGGLGLIRQLRERVPRLRSILLSDVDDPRVEERARACGAVECLPTPDLRGAGLDQIGDRLAGFSERVADLLQHPDRAARRVSARSTGTIRVVDPLSLLRGLIGEMQSEDEVEIPLLVLRLAAEYFERGVLFAVHGGRACSTGAFGGETEPEDGDGLDARIRGVRLPLQRGSVLERAVQKRQTYVGPVARTASNALLLDRLGSPIPTEAALLPLLSGRNVFGLLYGDNAPSGRPLGDLKALEIFLSQAGIALENAFLHRRIDSMAGGPQGAGPQGDLGAGPHA